MYQQNMTAPTSMSLEEEDGQDFAVATFIFSGRLITCTVKSSEGDTSYQHTFLKVYRGFCDGIILGEDFVPIREEFNRNIDRLLGQVGCHYLHHTFLSFRLVGPTVETLRLEATDTLATSTFVKYFFKLADVDVQLPTLDLCQLQLVEQIIDSNSNFICQSPFTKDRGQIAVAKLLEPHGLQFMGEPELHAQAMFNEIKVLTSLEPHPNLMPKPLALITFQNDGETLVAGFISKFLGESLCEHLLHSSDEQRLRYAHQCVQVLNHLHRVCQTFHGDLKLENLLVSTDRSNIILIDFEQSRFNAKSMAPESHGTFDVRLNEDGNLIYTPYRGPTRPVNPGIWNTWSIWKEWMPYPEAIERAEVFAFGIMLEQLLPESKASNEWSELVEICQSPNPLDRPVFNTILLIIANMPKHMTDHEPLSL